MELSRSGLHERQSVGWRIDLGFATKGARPSPGISHQRGGVALDHQRKYPLQEQSFVSKRYKNMSQREQPNRADQNQSLPDQADQSSSYESVFESYDLTRAEYISTMVHFYRGELHRSTEWRLRLDNTTNWAILSVMGLVTFSLGEASHSHIGILAGMALVFTFLTIEARRFRFFDVWRNRTRMLEENFIGPIVRRDLKSPIEDWGRMIAQDLIWPRFRITWYQALKARLMRNYLSLFVLLLVCWILKISLALDNALVTRQFELSLSPDYNNGIRVIASWASLVFVGCLYGYLLGVILLARPTSKPEEEYWQVGGVKAETMPILDR